MKHNQALAISKIEHLFDLLDRDAEKIDQALETAKNSLRFLAAALENGAGG